jgi:two-component system chemotaxis response regulator CheY
MIAEYSVLIIDDDIWMQRILSKTLQSYGFKKTYLASNGFEGISLAVEHSPSLIIMDIMMPELSGHLTMKIIKAIKHISHIPIIMVSALSDTENLGLAVKSGTAGFISKPFTRATVLEKLISIFGKDKLDLIAKGEADIYSNSDDFIPSENSLLPEIVKAVPNSNFERADDADIDDTPVKIVAPSEELKKQYKEEEKRSIESIKKLLIKSKK